MTHSMPTEGDIFESLRLELRRGSLILAVLGHLRREHYGYTLRKALGEAGVEIDEGALYPMLRRLEAQGPLSSPELETLLVDFGHPLVVAGRYRKVQQLIGPEVFPFWWAAVKTMLAIVAGVYLVLMILGVVTDKAPAEFNRSVPSIAMVVI